MTRWFVHKGQLIHFPLDSPMTYTLSPRKLELSAICKLWFIIRRKRISFVEFAIVMRINASYLITAPSANRRPARL